MYSNSRLGRLRMDSKINLGIMFSGGPVAFASTLQRVMSLSSAVAEYIAACSAIERLVFVRQLLDFFGMRQQQATPIMEENPMNE